MKQITASRSRIMFMFLLASIVFIAMISACSSNSKDSTKSGSKIKVVASENFYGEVAKAVGGNRVEVISLLDSPEADPHDYEATPNASKAVDDAKVVIYNGLGYDEWMKKLVDASGDAANKSVIVVGSDVAGKVDGDNEHVWYNPETMPKLANFLADQLSTLDPDNSNTYKKQAADYIATLDPFIKLVAEVKQASPLPIAVSEPVFDYMAQALNLEITNKKFELAAEEGTDPAPKDIAKLQDDIKAKAIKVFVNNIQASSVTVKNMVDLAKENGVAVIEVTETLPAGKNYVQWMVDQVNQIKAALK